jgi:hypothetical protein
MCTLSLSNVNPTAPRPIPTPGGLGYRSSKLKHHVSSIRKDTRTSTHTHTHTNKHRVKSTKQAYKLVTLANPYLAEDLPGGSTECISRRKERPATCSIYARAYAHSIDALLAQSTSALGRTENSDAQLYLYT